MFRFLANDMINDIALIQTSFGYSVRYGLEVTECHNDLGEALQKFGDCQHHALASEIENLESE